MTVGWTSPGSRRASTRQLQEETEEWRVITELTKASTLHQHKRLFLCRKAQKREIEEKDTKLVEGDGIGG